METILFLLGMIYKIGIVLTIGAFAVMAVKNDWSICNNKPVPED